MLYVRLRIYTDNYSGADYISSYYFPYTGNEEAIHQLTDLIKEEIGPESDSFRISNPMPQKVAEIICSEIGNECPHSSHVLVPGRLDLTRLRQYVDATTYSDTPVTDYLYTTFKLLLVSA